MQAEQVRRATPPAVSAQAISSKSEIDAAVQREATFLFRYGGRLSTDERAKHQERLQTLEMRSEQLQTRLVSRTSVAKVTVTEPSQEEVYAKYLEMIDAMRGSASAGLTFLYMLSRGGTLDAARTLVTATAHLSDVAASMPVRGARNVPADPKVDPKREVGVENPETLRRFLDESLGRGHATDTRFRGIDNSSFEMDPDKRTYGPYRTNSGGVRSVNQAIEIFEKQTGIKIPPWIKVTVDPKVSNDRMAQYTLVRAADVGAQFSIEELRERGVTINLRPDILASDEAIVGTLRHELHELMSLEAMLEESGLMTYRDVLAQIAPNRGNNLHGQAWDVADIEVMLMRSTPGTAEHAALLSRREKLVHRFEQQNLGDR